MPLTRKLPELPFALLSSLVRACFRQDLFSYPTIQAQYTLGSVPEVFTWVGIEEVKRFALALYKVCRLCDIPDKEKQDDSSESRQRKIQPKSLLSLADLHFAMPECDELWHADSNLAARLAEEDSMAYSHKNMEVNWISSTARLLQRDNVAFAWI